MTVPTETSPDDLLPQEALVAWGLEAGDVPELHRLGAVGFVRSWCRWHIAPVVQFTITGLDLDGSGLLYLPAMQVVDVTQVLVDGAELTPSWSRHGILDVPRRRARRAVSVTFTAGYEEAPDDVRAVAARLAAESSATPDGAQREQVAADSVAHGPGNGRLSHADIAALGPYRRPLGP